MILQINHLYKVNIYARNGKPSASREIMTLMKLIDGKNCSILFDSFLKMRGLYSKSHSTPLLD